MESSAHLLLPMPFLSQWIFPLKVPTRHAEYARCWCGFSAQQLPQSPRLARAGCPLSATSWGVPPASSRNTGSVGEWEEAQRCVNQALKTYSLMAFTAGRLYIGCLRLTLYFFSSQSRRKGCLSALQYSWPPYISVLLKYQGTNDMWHQWKTRKLRPTFLARLLLLYPLEEQPVNELSCRHSASPSFWILFTCERFNKCLTVVKNQCRIQGLPPSPVSFVHRGVTSPSFHLF